MGAHTNFPAYQQPTVASRVKRLKVQITFAAVGVLGAFVNLAYPLFTGGSASILRHYVSVALAIITVGVLGILRFQLAELKDDQER